MKRFKTTCDIGIDKVLNYTLVYITNDSELPELVDWMKQRTSFAIDLETDGLDPHVSGLATLQIGDPRGDDPHAYVIDVRCVSKKAMKPILNMLVSRDYLKLGMNIAFEYRFLRKNYGIKMRKLADIQIAELVLRAGLFPEGYNVGGGEDGFRKPALGATSMAKLCMRYLGIGIKKYDYVRLSFYKTPAGTHSREQLEYAAGDVIFPFYVAQQQRKEIEERQLKSIIEIEFETIPIMAEAQFNGVGINQPAWRKLWQEAEKSKAEFETKLDDYFRGLHPQEELFDQSKTRPLYKNGSELNYGSSDHIRWAIAEYCKKIGWPIEVVTEEKRAKELLEQYGEGFLEWLKQRDPTATIENVPDHVVPLKAAVMLTSAERKNLQLAKVHRQLPGELIDLLVGYSETSKRANTFGVEFLNKHVHPVTKRIHPEFNQAVTSTGRISQTPNLQNIPRDPRYRHCFVPKKGYSFVIADYSQIEPRLSAQVSDDPTYVGTFLDDDDIYSRVAEAMTGTRPDRTTEQGAIMRQIFKTIVLALAYRMGPPKLWATLCLALSEEIAAGKTEAPRLEDVRELHKRFFEVHPGIKQYQETCEKAASPSSPSAPKVWDRYAKAAVTWITAPCGRKRFFPPDHRGIYTEAPNAPIQGCSATITKAAACLVEREIDKDGWDATCIHMVHDEIIWEVRDDQADKFAPLAKDLMEKAGATWITKVPVKAEFPKGTNGVVKVWTKERADV